MARRAAVLWALACAHCAFTDPGEGSRSLQVVGSFVYEAGVQDDTTAVTLDVSRAGAAVAATVTVTDVDAGLPFVINTVAGSGHYAGALPGYRRHLQVRVEDGDDHLRARLEVPGPTTLRAPTAGAVQVAADPTAVLWRAEDGLRADEVIVTMQKDGYRAVLTEDAGRATIAGNVLAPGDDTLVLTRRASVVPAGGTGRSLLQADYVVRVAYSRI